MFYSELCFTMMAMLRKKGNDMLDISYLVYSQTREYVIKIQYNSVYMIKNFNGYQFIANGRLKGSHVRTPMHLQNYCKLGDVQHFKMIAPTNFK